MNKFTFEIETSDGNGIMAFEISVAENGELEITKTWNCNLADVDGDYIFNTENSLYRIQAD